MLSWLIVKPQRRPLKPCRVDRRLQRRRRLDDELPLAPLPAGDWVSQQLGHGRGADATPPFNNAAFAMTPGHPCVGALLEAKAGGSTAAEKARGAGHLGLAAAHVGGRSAWPMGATLLFRATAEGLDEYVRECRASTLWREPFHVALSSRMWQAYHESRPGRR